MQQPSIGKAALVMIAIVVAVVWVAGAWPNRDPVWFLPFFREQPEAITIYWDGTEVTLYPGDPGYDDLNNAISYAVTHVAAHFDDWGLSENMVARLKTEGRVIMVYYAEPVQIHTHYLFAQLDVLLIPLSYASAEQQLIFGQRSGIIRIGGLKVEGFEALIAAAESVAASP